MTLLLSYNILMKTVAITGATYGIGKATAKHFAAQDWQVVRDCYRTDSLSRVVWLVTPSVRQISTSTDHPGPDTMDDSVK